MKFTSVLQQLKFAGKWQIFITECQTPACLCVDTQECKSFQEHQAWETGTWTHSFPCYWGFLCLGLNFWVYILRHQTTLFQETAAGCILAALWLLHRAVPMVPVPSHWPGVQRGQCLLQGKVLHAEICPQASPSFCVNLAQPARGGKSSFILDFSGSGVYLSGLTGPVLELKRDCSSGLGRTQTELISVLKRREDLMYSWPWCLGWVAFKIQPGGSFANFRDVWWWDLQQWCNTMDKSESESTELLPHLMGTRQQNGLFCFKVLSMSIK